jgi:hypothetical protein
MIILLTSLSFYFSDQAELIGMSVGIGVCISIGIFVFSCFWEKYRKIKAMRQGAIDLDPLASKKSKIAWHK